MFVVNMGIILRNVRNVRLNEKITIFKRCSRGGVFLFFRMMLIMFSAIFCKVTKTKVNENILFPIFVSLVLQDISSPILNPAPCSYLRPIHSKIL